MEKWSKTIQFESKNKQNEVWICNDSKTEKRYNVEVTLGKPVDILSLKLNMVEDFNLSVKKIRNLRISMFKGSLQHVDFCPICKCETKDSKEVFKVYGAKYHQCSNCSHLFVIERPTKKALNEFYSKDKLYQKTYTDKRTTEIRIKQVAIPKAEWVIKQFKRIHGRDPKSILDVGAGSGWTTALLAEIVGERGKVFAIEIVPELKEFGERNVRQYEFIKKGIVKFILADGSKGYPSIDSCPELAEGFDRILASASAREIPQAWKEQLKVGGRIVAPIDSSIWVLIKESEKNFKKIEYPGFAFVPLISEQ